MKYKIDLDFSHVTMQVMYNAITKLAPRNPDFYSLVSSVKECTRTMFVLRFTPRSAHGVSVHLDENGK